MKTVSIRFSDMDKKTLLYLGYVGENLHRRILIDCKKEFEEMPGAIPALVVTAPNGLKYPVDVTVEGNTVIWDITNSDLIHHGNGEIQLTLTKDSEVGKSAKCRTKVDESIEPDGEAPDPIENWLIRAENLLEEIPEEIADAIEEAKASGMFDGVGISSIGYVKTVGKVNTYRINLTDGSFYDFEVSNGEDGQPGTNGVGIANIAKTGTVGLVDTYTITLTNGQTYPFTVTNGQNGAEIDDTTPALNKVFSSFKVNEELTQLKSAITAMGSDVTDLNGAVFTSEEEIVDAPNLFETVTDTEMRLNFSAGVFGQSEALYGFYVDIHEYRGKKILIKRDNTGQRLRGAFTQEIPAVGVAYTNDFDKWAGISRARTIVVPDSANYMYLAYYSATDDTNTREQCLAGMTVVQIDDKNLFDDASNDLTLSLDGEVYGQGTILYGFYVPIDIEAGNAIVISRTNTGTRFRCAFSSEIPAVGVQYMSYTKQIYDEKNNIYIIVPNGAKYLYIAYYNSNSDSKTKQQLIDGMDIRYCIPAKITDDTGKQSRIEELRNDIYIKAKENLLNEKSEIMTLGMESYRFVSGTTLFGFYVPIDPAKGTTITIRRKNAGQRFRVVSCANVPAVNVSFTNNKRKDNDNGKSIVYDRIELTDKYMYVAFYSSTYDTLTKEELLQGMTIIYGTDADYVAEESRIDRLDYARECTFTNGNINGEGGIIESAKHIVSNFIRINGRYGISTPATYKITVHEYDYNGKYIYSYNVTNAVKYYYHWGMLRVCISKSDNTDISPSTVDFSQIKMPISRYSAKGFVDSETVVLDAENSTIDDVYAYYDRSVATHNRYASKTFLCNEESGLPIYYYTLGSGAKKICIITGQHGPGAGGDPRDSVITVAKMMHDMMEGNFADGSLLQMLHDDCTVMVFPVFNPYGYNFFRRTNAEQVDTNRDWADKETDAVSNAEPVISAFDADIILDVHCNGTTPLDNADVEMQFNYGDYNTTFKNAVKDYFASYYNIDLLARTDASSANPEKTLSYYIRVTKQKLGGLIEMRWFLKESAALHNEQIESANYAFIVNSLKYFLSVLNSTQFVLEKTPNQNQY